jgi:hypothetical protein
MYVQTENTQKMCLYRRKISNAFKTKNVSAANVMQIIDKVESLGIQNTAPPVTYTIVTEQCACSDLFVMDWLVLQMQWGREFIAWSFTRKAAHKKFNPGFIRNRPQARVPTMWGVSKLVHGPIWWQKETIQRNVVTEEKVQEMQARPFEIVETLGTRKCGFSLGSAFRATR